MVEEKHATEIAQQGYTVIPDVLTATQIAEARAALKTVLKAEARQAAAKGWQNKNHSVAYLLPQKHPFFRSIGNNPRLLPIVQSVIGIDCRISAINGFDVHHGGEEQRLHMDAPQSTPSICVYLNALHCLDDFHEGNGGTRLVPHSQKSARQRDEGVDESIHETVVISASAGSVIAFDGGILHAASKNNSGSSRGALHVYYRRKWAAADWDYPRSLSRSVRSALTEEEKRLFGFYDLTPVYEPLTHHIVRTFPRARWKDMARYVLRRR